MPSQESINGEIFNRINSLESTMSEMRGMLQAHLSQNEKLLKVVSMALKVLAVLAFVMLCALIYGAIGKDGLHSVRESANPLAKAVGSYIAPPPENHISLVTEDV